LNYGTGFSAKITSIGRFYNYYPKISYFRGLKKFEDGRRKTENYNI